MKEDNSEWAEKTIETLLKVSPASLKITMKAIQIGSTLSLADCLRMEYRLACAALSKTSDFCEGSTSFKDNFILNDMFFTYNII